MEFILQVLLDNSLSNNLHQSTRGMKGIIYSVMSTVTFQVLHNGENNSIAWLQMIKNSNMDGRPRTDSKIKWNKNKNKTECFLKTSKLQRT